MPSDSVQISPATQEFIPILHKDVVGFGVVVMVRPVLGVGVVERQYWCSAHTVFAYSYSLSLVVQVLA